MKKIDFEKLKGKKGAFIGLVFFVALFAIGAALFSGGSVTEVPQLIDTVPVTPSEVPPDVASSGADPGPQDNSGSGPAFVAKKYYSTNGYSTNTPASVQAATETHYDQPSTDLPSDPGSDDENIDPDEEIVDPEDIEEVDDTEISDEEPIPDDDDEIIDDDTPEDDDTNDDEVTEETDEDEIDPGDVGPVNDEEEEIPDDLPSNEDLEDWINS